MRTIQSGEDLFDVRRLSAPTEAKSHLSHVEEFHRPANIHCEISMFLCKFIYGRVRIPTYLDRVLRSHKSAFQKRALQDDISLR